MNDNPGTRAYIAAIQTGSHATGQWVTLDPGQTWINAPRDETPEATAHRALYDIHYSVVPVGAPGTETRCVLWDGEDAEDLDDHDAPDVDAVYILDYVTVPRRVSWAAIREAGIDTAAVEVHTDNSCGADLGLYSAESADGEEQLLFGVALDDGSNSRPGEHLGWYAAVQERGDSSWVGTTDPGMYWEPAEAADMLAYVAQWVGTHGGAPQPTPDMPY